MRYRSLIITTAFSLFFFLPAVLAQVTAVRLNVTVPLPDTSSKPVYVAGSFNYWHAGDSLYRMKKTGEGAYSIELPVFSNHSYEYKYTRGDWGSVETALNDSTIHNRRFFSGENPVMNDKVDKWKTPEASKQNKPSPQMERVNAMKDSVMGNLKGELEGMKGLFKPYIQNLLEDHPSMALNKRINKKAVKKIGNAYNQLSQLLWEVFGMLTPEQKKKIRDSINTPAANTDIINAVGNALNKALETEQPAP